MPDFRSRLAVLQRSDEWFRIENRAAQVADVHIFDEIGFFGLTAADFVNQLKDVSAKEIRLHINSPGGEVYDGIAIRNAVRDHPARVTAFVDGVAASSASFIALAADEVVMNRNAEFMIHEPMGGVIGNAAEVSGMVADLNRIGDNIASMYAEKAGGTPEEWRTRMRAETWYTADEAVAAGLADRVQDKDAAVTNRFDFAIFNYAGRAKAPPPLPATETPAASADGQPEQKEQDSMSDLMSTLRTKLGITDDSADEGTILAALDEALAEQTEPPVQNKVRDTPRDLKKLADAAGAVIVDRGVWEESQRRIQEGVDAARELRNQKRDALLDVAVQDGRIPPASKQHWSDLYDRDPKGAGEVIENLRKNSVPVAELGYSLDNDENDLGEFAALFPKGR